MRILSAACVALVAVAPAGAVTVVGFEGVNATYPSTGSAQILGFYNGGTSSDGTSGANFGMTFSANAVAVCLNSMTTTCSNASTGGFTPTSRKGALGLASSGVAVLDLASAYNGAIGFRYAVAPTGIAFIKAYDGAGGTGTLLANLPLFGVVPGCPAYAATLCPFSPGGLGLLSNVRSLVFGGMVGGVVWDDLTFGAGNDPLPPPALPVPEPVSWMTMLAGLMLIGAVLRRRTAQAARSYSSISPDR
jgi:hypothetical protein